MHLVLRLAMGMGMAITIVIAAAYGTCRYLAARSKRYRIATKGKVISCLPLSVLLWQRFMQGRVGAKEIRALERPESN